MRTSVKFDMTIKLSSKDFEEDDVAYNLLDILTKVRFENLSIMEPIEDDKLYKSVIAIICNKDDTEDSEGRYFKPTKAFSTNRLIFSMRRYWQLGYLCQNLASHQGIEEIFIRMKDYDTDLEHRDKCNALVSSFKNQAIRSFRIQEK